MVKHALPSARDMRDMGSVSGSGKSTGGGHGNTLHYFFLENHRKRSLAGYRPEGLKESGMIEETSDIII